MSNNEIEVYKADTVSIVITVKNSNDIAINITGYTFYFTVKSSYSDSDATAKINKTITSHNDPTNGQTTVTLSATDTNQTAGNYYYDIIMKDGSSNVTTLLHGIFKVLSRVRIAAS